jgi:hypothetical protein
MMLIVVTLKRPLRRGYADPNGKVRKRFVGGREMVAFIAARHAL